MNLHPAVSGPMSLPFCFISFQCSDASSGPFTELPPVCSAVSEGRPAIMSSDTVGRAEPESEHQAELADLVAAMNVASNCPTPPNGHRPGPPRTNNTQRARLSDRKLSLQERGSRIARQPTIETKRVSITDADVRSFTPTQPNILHKERFRKY